MKTITYDDAVWKLVPIEPTEKMIVEGFESEPNDYFTNQDELERYKALSGCRQAAYRASKCWSAMLRAAPTPPADGQVQPVVNQQLTTEPSAQDDATLADTQRQIIEAAEQRGYARAKSECGQDREDAKRYTWLRDYPPKDCQGGMRVRIWGESGDWTSISGEKLDAAIDAAWAAKGE